MKIIMLLSGPHGPLHGLFIGPGRIGVTTRVWIVSREPGNAFFRTFRAADACLGAGTISRGQDLLFRPVLTYCGHI
jgi:hypothetical protein